MTRFRVESRDKGDPKLRLLAKEGVRGQEGFSSLKIGCKEGKQKAAYMISISLGVCRKASLLPVLFSYPTE